MKQIYPFAILTLALASLTGTISAQTYSGGSYTAVRNGKWHTPSGPNVWDPNGEPPSTCNNCLITINTGTSVTLNTSVTLAGSSLLQIGTDASAATELLIPASVSPAGTAWNNSNNVIVTNDGSSPANQIQLANSSAFINATSADNSFDGIFTTFSNTPTIYFKQVGNGPSAYSGTAVINQGSINRNSLTGPVTLSGNGTLPIVLSAFDAVLNNSVVDLTWTTDMEINSDHFTIERSTNAGTSWSPIGTVSAQGFSSLPVNYSFTDGSPVSGADQYRLESVDRDGKFTYSDIKVVRVGVISKVTVFPNPARDNVNITLGEGNASFSGSVRILSLSGQLLAEKIVSNTAGGSTISMSVGGYTPGNYLVLVTGSDGTQQVTKLSVSR
jgi:type IX secretion system substrate protein